MKLFRLLILVYLLIYSSNLHAQISANWWLTTPDTFSLLQQQSPLSFLKENINKDVPAIVIDPTIKFQTMDGFGFALTGGSAQLMMRMEPGERKKLINELFGLNGNNIGISYLRLSIGASDLNDHVFSYDDLPAGATDFELKSFDLNQDKLDVIPVLKEILSINPLIKILASPWSAPAWMKTNNNIQGGHLKINCYGVYAAYFLKYIKAMKTNGITIDAVTLQNEPFNDGNTPSMQLFAKEQALFIKKYIGPLFKAKGIKTKIILYDHNCDAPEYPISILTDAEAAKYVDGSGFHLYAGPITALTKVHNAFPDKQLYFTEMMVTNRNGFAIANPVDYILIGAIRNWSRNIILWNLAADQFNKPHTDNGGCAGCQGAITIDGNKVSRNLAYYVIAHASKFIPAGSVRVASNANELLPNVAFKTPAGKTVLIVANKEKLAQKFNISVSGKFLQSDIPGGSVATFIW